MTVGDDAQCIYSWRGANFENIMTFPKRHAGTVIHRIETNYRSTPLILAFFFSSRRPHTRCLSDWSSDVCSSDLKKSAQWLQKIRPFRECPAVMQRPCSSWRGM